MTIIVVVLHNLSKSHSKSKYLCLENLNSSASHKKIKEINFIMQNVFSAVNW